MSHARIIDMEAAIRHGKDPMPWRVACFLADGAVTTMAGVRGGAKSWLAMATCAAVGRGDAVVGMQCTEGTALYIDAENGWRVMGRRFHVSGLDHDAFIVANGMGLRLPKDDETVRALITETSATVCVLDSLRRLAPGAREDKSDDMAPIYSGLSGIAQQTGCALLVLHHRSTKFGAPDMRSSSAIEDQSDLCFVLERARNDPEGKTRKRLRCTKNRLDSEPPARWMRLDHAAGFVTVNEATAYVSADSDDDAMAAHDDLAKRMRELAAQVVRDGGGRRRGWRQRSAPTRRMGPSSAR